MLTLIDKVKTSIHLLLMSISFSVMCYGQQKMVVPPDFFEVTPPEAYSDAWFRIHNSSNNTFEVKVEDGVLGIRKIRERYTFELKIPSGTLYAYAGGESGGLKFVPFADPKKQMDMEFATIKSIFLYNNDIYISAGGFWEPSGALYKLNIEEGKRLTYEKVLDFEDVPLAQAIYNDKLLVVTAKNVYIIDDFKKELLFENTPWNGLVPNSVAVIDEKNIFMGMRGGIAWLDLETRKLRFFANRQSEHSEEQDCENNINAELAYEIYSRMKYPMIDYANNIEGYSVYQLDTDSVGRIVNMQLVSSSGSLTLDMEAKRILYEIPRQKLCKNTTQAITINFRLADNIIYKEEEMTYRAPQFPGGRSAALVFIRDNMHYPPEAAEMAIQGKIVCGFVVEKDGTIGMVEVLTPLHRFFDAEVVRVIKRMPLWMPGRRMGRLVRVYCTVAVNVSIKD